MLAKEMFLKINKTNLILFLAILFFFCVSKANNDNENLNVANYFLSLENFSAQFIQTDGVSLEEGSLYIGENRLRVEYNKPSKILLIMDENKAMYHNYDLEETEFFNPENTSAWIFLEIFKNEDFFNDMNKTKNNNTITFFKKITVSDVVYNLEIYFEDLPLVLRKIKLKYNDEYLEISLSNHDFNAVFNKKFFKMINPELLN